MQFYTGEIMAVAVYRDCITQERGFWNRLLIRLRLRRSKLQKRLLAMAAL